MASKVALACAVCASLQGVGALRQRQSSEQTSTWNTVLIDGKSDIKRPAFLKYDAVHDDIIVSQFGRTFAKGTWSPVNLPAQSTISRIPRASIARQIGARSMTENYGTNEEWNKVGLEWPNKLSKTPDWMGDYVVVPDGFLPPGKANGGLFLCDRSGVVHRISEFETGAFYHEVEFHDFNGDGLEDILTVRTVKGGPFFRPSFSGAMYWYENPGKNNMFDLWTEHKIVDGPDVIFKSIPHGDGLAIYCTEFFRPDPRMTLHFINMKAEHQSFRIVDGNMGKPFGVELVDLDGDGVKELLATNHQGNFKDNDDNIKAAVFAYEIPSDITSGSFSRHIISWDPSPLKDDNTGAGAPGFAYGFHPKIGTSSSEPKWIAAAGDGCLDVWIMRPTGNRFEYETELVYIDGTTGELLLMDFDNDGIMDILIPDNDNFNLRAITFEQR